MRMSGIELQQATGGKWQSEAPALVHGICTDSRTFTPPAAFLALRGPNFDGHIFGERLDMQAEALIGDSKGAETWQHLHAPQLLVNDTLQALGDIAAAWRRKLEKTTVVAITGSYGKTTVRSMLQHLLESAGLSVAATRKNLNNLVGVPHTLLAVPESADIALIECGISERGEMQKLASIVQPDVAILTGFATAHGAGLGGADGIVREKAWLTATLTHGGWMAAGAGVTRKLAANSIAVPKQSLDMDRDDSQNAHWHLDGDILTLQLGEQTASLPMALPAKHFAANMALAVSVAARLLQKRRNISLTAMAMALQQWQPVAGRMQSLPGPNGSRIIDDAYNANPTSMQAALDTLAALPGRHFAVLGDMGELGNEAEMLHQGLRIPPLEGLLLVGPLMQKLCAIHTDALWARDADAAVKQMAGFDLMPGDTVLIKASRAMQLDRIVKSITQESAHAL